jgi:hypothetical protein
VGKAEEREGEKNQNFKFMPSLGRSAYYQTPRISLLRGQSPRGGDAYSGLRPRKALQFTHITAFGLEYRWDSDPANDAFVDLPSSSGYS